VASQDVPTTSDKRQEYFKKKEIHMALMQRGLLFITTGTNLSGLEI
jgi:hypothetical protein